MKKKLLTKFNNHLQAKTPSKVRQEFLKSENGQREK